MFLVSHMVEILKLKNMKTSVRIILLLSIIGISLGSCVSSKKYKASQSRNAQLEQQVRELQNSNSKLQGDVSQMKSSLSSSQQDLNAKDRMLADEQKRMQELKALVDDERDAIRKLKQEVCSALKCFTPDELSIEVRNGKLYVSMSDKLLFPSGSDVVNARGKEAITMLAQVLKNSDLEVMVEGHTDPVPIHTDRNKDNWDLSVHRATSVTRIFTDNGIPSERIIASGRAFYHPVAENESAEGRQTNRRTEIVLAPKLDKLWKLAEAEDISTSSGNKPGKK
jgi:chemotaxis protein MotB